MDNWYTIDEIDADTYIISEYRHWEETHCYLLNGNTRSLLIDTGLGISNIYEEVLKLTDKPITAVATLFSGIILEGISISQIFMPMLMNWIGWMVNSLYQSKR